MYLTAAAPGKMRGAHYHCKTWEWFLVIKGSARFLAKPEASPEWSSLDLSEDVPKLIEVPPFVAHVFVGTGSMEMVLLAYSNRPFDPNDADTYPKEP
jgi:dTDP-4-dehydrorhamnose 3,5-epimerase